MWVNNKETHDNCPLCRSKSIYHKGHLNYRGKINFSTREIEINQLPEFWTCRQCQSGFVQYTVAEETARMLYSTSRAGDRWSTLPFDQNKTRNVIDTMASIFEYKGSVLDVGCNTGELLDFAQTFGCRTSGVEYSVASREKLVSKGHQAYPSFEEAEGCYDVIVAFDLIEHLYNVPAFLKGCREKLAENGKLLILTGSIDSFSARLAGANWWYGQYPEHIVFPSRKYFSVYSGLKMERWVSTYASKGYQKPIYKVVWGVLKSMLRGTVYTGLPSIGSDHVLAVLTK